MDLSQSEVSLSAELGNLTLSPIQSNLSLESINETQEQNKKGQKYQDNSFNMLFAKQQQNRIQLQQRQNIIENKFTTEVPKVPLRFDEKQYQEFQQQFFSSNKTKNQKSKQEYLISPQLVSKQKQILIQVPLEGKNETSEKNTICKVYFPFQPYQVQKKYMKVLITALQNKQNCLLESPSGTGKTQCLLNGVLSWVQSDYNRRRAMKSDVSKIKILYLLRTHSQLIQVQNELSKTCFRPTMAVIGSRDHLCINEAFSNSKKSIDKNFQCSKAIKKENKAKFLKLKGQKIPEQLLDGICRYHTAEHDTLKIHKENLQKKIIDQIKIKQLGRELNFCPYFYPQHIKDQVDIFFMPYNYLLQEQLLKKYKQLVNNSIVIFDQGHNVQEAACENKKFILTNKMITEAKRQIITNISLPNKQYDDINQSRSSTLNAMQQISKHLDNWLKNISQYFQSQSVSRNFPKAIEYIKSSQYFYQLLMDEEKIRKLKGQKHKSRDFEKNKQQQLCIKLSQLISAISLVIDFYKKTINGEYKNLKKLKEFFEKIHYLSQPQSEKRDLFKNQRQYYRLILKKQSIQAKQILCSIQLVCLNPALMFQMLLSMNPRNIILTSGTLAPLNTWSCQLKVPFLYQLQNKHVIKPQQLQLMIVKKGIGNNRFNFSYANTNDNRDIFKDLAHSVVRLIKKIPNGVLMVFPSYKFLKQFENQLRQQKLYAQLNQSKQIFSQSKSLSEGYLKRYVDKAKERGAIMFCVCRGKVSEGIDFTDQQCRAVIFVGVPYPNIKDPMIAQKRSYLDDLNRRTIHSEFQSIKGQQWYELQTMRAVNQAIGRVIRHANDFGTIYLLDERYLQQNLSKYFPKWAKQFTTHNQNFQQILSKTEEFYYKFQK